jgi:hypothetical protein
MDSGNERMQVLQMIEEGQISAAEGLRRLDALNAAAAEMLPAASQTAPEEDLAYWRRWWLLPMAVGTGVVLLGAVLMFAAYQAGGLGFWFLCAGVPFALGVLIMALAAGSRSARWLHVRVRSDPARQGQRHDIALSFPLPIRLTAWLLRLVGPLIPQLKDHGLDELILALAENTSAEAPLYVDVNEGNGGERVQVYLG